MSEPIKLPCRHFSDAPKAVKGKALDLGADECAVCWWYLNDERYAAHFEGRPVPPQDGPPKYEIVNQVRVSVPPPSPDGPGAKLRELFKELGIVEKPGCGCAKLASKMDLWGVAGCQARRGELITTLREKADDYGGLEKLNAAGRTLIKVVWPAILRGDFGVLYRAAGVPFRVTDPLGILIDEAIRRAAGGEVVIAPDDPRYEPGRKHLLYHIMPTRGKGVWQLNLDRLLPRINLFDGIRSIAIVRDPGCDPAVAVQSYFGSTRIDNWIILDNDHTLREVKTWWPLWETLSAGNPQSYVWYAQAKGVTRPVNPGTTIHRWTRLLYAANLDYWPEVEKLLQQYPVVGALKKVGFGFRGSRSAFHFSGSFFWARLGDALPHAGTIDQAWWGNESWPGLHFKPSEAGCIGGVEGRCPELDAYHFKRFERMERDFRQWTEARS